MFCGIVCKAIFALFQWKEVGLVSKNLSDKDINVDLVVLSNHVGHKHLITYLADVNYICGMLL
jgi:hypothetical protein